MENRGADRNPFATTQSHKPNNNSFAGDQAGLELPAGIKRRDIRASLLAELQLGQRLPARSVTRG
jgi:hypothetical protein